MKDWHTDADMAVNGVPLDLGDGRALLVRYGGTMNRDFMAAMVGVEENDTPALAQVCARTLVTGWRGITDEAGEPVPFSTEACVELYGYAPELVGRTWIFAAQRANFRVQEMAADKEQLKKSSGGAKAQAHTRRS